MAVKFVDIPGASKKALSVGYQLIVKMRASNQLGVKAIEVAGTLVIVRRTSNSEIVLPIIPRLKTFNSMELTNNGQELIINNFDDLFNSLGGIVPIKLLTVAEVNDPENKEGKKILSIDFPDFHRVLGARFEPLYSNIYNTYIHALSNEGLKTFVDDSLTARVVDKTETDLKFQKTTEFYNNVGDSFLPHLLSQIPDGVCVEDILKAVAGGVHRTFPTYNGIKITSNTRDVLDSSLVTINPIFVRKTPAGNYVVICEAFGTGGILRDPEDFIPIPDFYSGEDLLSTVNINNSRNSLIVISAEDFYSVKNIPFSTGTSRDNASSFNALEPGEFIPDDFEFFTGRFFDTPFSINGDTTGNDFNYYPTENILEHLDVNVNALFNVKALYDRYGEGRTNIDYSQGVVNDLAVDEDLIFDHGSLPWDQLAQHNDWIQNIFYFTPLRVDITKNDNTYTGKLVYTVSVFDPKFIDGTGVFFVLDAIFRPTILDQVYIPDLMTFNEPAIKQYLSVLNMTVTTATFRTQIFGTDITQIISSEGNFDDVVTDNSKLAVLNSYVLKPQANREIYIGWTFFESIINSKTRTGSFDTDDNILDFADTQNTHTRNQLDQRDYIFDHDGSNFTLENNNEKVNITINNTKSSYSAIGTTINNYTPAAFTVSQPGYSVFYKPTPDTQILAYKVGSLLYSYTKGSVISGPATVIVAPTFSTPDRVFTNGFVVNAQNSPAPEPNIQIINTATFSGTEKLGDFSTLAADLQWVMGDRTIHWDRDTKELKEGNTVLYNQLPVNTRLAGQFEQATNFQDVDHTTIADCCAMNYSLGTAFESNYDFEFGDPEDPDVTIASDYSGPAYTITIAMPIVIMRILGDNLPHSLVTVPHQTFVQQNDAPTNSTINTGTLSLTSKKAGTNRAVDTDWPLSFVGNIKRIPLEGLNWVFASLETKPIYYTRGVFQLIGLNSVAHIYKTLISTPPPASTGGATYDAVNDDNFVYPSMFMSPTEIKIALTNTFPEIFLLYNEYLNSHFFIDPVTGVPISDIEFAGIPSITNFVRRNIYINRAVK